MDSRVKENDLREGSEGTGGSNAVDECMREKCSEAQSQNLIHRTKPLGKYFSGTEVLQEDLCPPCMFSSTDPSCHEQNLSCSGLSGITDRSDFRKLHASEFVPSEPSAGPYSEVIDSEWKTCSTTPLASKEYFPAELVPNTFPIELSFIGTEESTSRGNLLDLQEFHVQSGDMAITRTDAKVGVTSLEDSQNVAQTRQVNSGAHGMDASDGDDSLASVQGMIIDGPASLKNNTLPFQLISTSQEHSGTRRLMHCRSAPVLSHYLHRIDRYEDLMRFSSFAEEAASEDSRYTTTISQVSSLSRDPCIKQSTIESTKATESTSSSYPLNKKEACFSGLDAGNVRNHDVHYAYLKTEAQESAARVTDFDQKNASYDVSCRETSGDSKSSIDYAPLTSMIQKPNEHQLLPGPLVLESVGYSAALKRSSSWASMSRSCSSPADPAINAGAKLSTTGGNRKKSARQGVATDHAQTNTAARDRRERINERLKTLQGLIPNGTNVDMVTMLEKAVDYVRFLQLRVEVLSNDEHRLNGRGNITDDENVDDGLAGYAAAVVDEDDTESHGKSVVTEKTNQSGYAIC